MDLGSSTSDYLQRLQPLLSPLVPPRRISYYSRTLPHRTPGALSSTSPLLPRRLSVHL